MSLFTPLLQAQGKSGAAGGARRLLQRACDCDGKTNGDCESCRKKKLQRKAGGGTPFEPGTRVAAPPQLTQGGARLDANVAGRLGPLFGTDFADVRVHRDAASAAAAREVGARAFTLGRHIHFGAGQWRPQARDGLHLIAHELSHTLQHAEGSGDGVEIDAPDSPLEREADHVADAVLAGRAAQVRGAGGGRVSRRLLQRAPDDTKASGIGTASGGSETASVDRTVDENTSIHITRTVTEPPCTKKAVKTATPSDKIFYWDKQAEAIGFRYSSCNGQVQLSTSGKIDYSEVVKSATGLLTTLQNNPALGANFGQLLQNRLDAAQLKGSGDITLTFDGLLQASVEATATAGTGTQQLTLQGKVKITPKGLTFIVTGGLDLKSTALQKSATYKAEFQAGTENYSVAVSYEQVDQSLVGGPSSSKQTIEGGLFRKIPDTPLTKDTRCGVIVVETPGAGQPSVQLGCKGTIDTSRAPKVECFECDCPPPKPEYACRRDVKKHKVEDRPAQNRPVRLTYQYNKALPANEKDYAGGVSAIAGLAKAGFSVARIWGYASPEGSLDAPARGGGVFKGNQALSQARADYARTRIAKELPEVALPPAEGHGELLGSLGDAPDVADKDITPDLVALLKDETPDKRLEILGVSQQVLDDPKRRQRAIDDIQAFIDGRQKGVTLGERPRWEKVFPFLRRVEVMMHLEALTHDVEASAKATDCAPEDLAYAKEKLSPLPPERRIPKESCDPRASVR